MCHIKSEKFYITDFSKRRTFSLSRKSEHWRSSLWRNSLPFPVSHSCLLQHRNPLCLSSGSLEERLGGTVGRLERSYNPNPGAKTKQPPSPLPQCVPFPALFLSTQPELTGPVNTVGWDEGKKILVIRKDIKWIFKNKI